MELVVLVTLFDSALKVLCRDPESCSASTIDKSIPLEIDVQSTLYNTKRRSQSPARRGSCHSSLSSINIHSRSPLSASESSSHDGWSESVSVSAQESDISIAFCGDAPALDDAPLLTAVASLRGIGRGAEQAGERCVRPARVAGAAL